MAGDFPAEEPLRAAQLVKCLGLGGTERQVVELLRGLDRARVTPLLACLMKHGELLEPVYALGFDPPEFPLHGSMARPNTAIQAVRLAAWLRRERAAVLHCHDFYSNVIGAMAARLAGVPWIASRRDLGVWGGPAHGHLRAAMTRLAPAVLCNSQAVRDLVVHGEGIPAERVHVVPNGLDLDRFDQESSLGLNQPLPALDAGGPIVALVANMKLGVKGHGDFLLAAVEVRRAVSGARFLLIGDGELRPEIEARAYALGLGESVLFTGYRTDVPALLARTTVAVSASRSEGFSNAIMEAMAASRPVVATLAGGNSELVRDGHTGFLVPARQPQLLAGPLVELLRAPELAERLGRAGRRRLEDEFSVRRLGARVTELYQELVGSRVHGAATEAAA